MIDVTHAISQARHTLGNELDNLDYVAGLLYAVGLEKMANIIKNSVSNLENVVEDINKQYNIQIQKELEASNNSTAELLSSIFKGAKNDPDT